MLSAFYPFNLLRKRRLEARLRKLKAQRDHVTADLVCDRLLLAEIRTDIARTERELAEHQTNLLEVHP